MGKQMDVNAPPVGNLVRLYVSHAANHKMIVLVEHSFSAKKPAG